MERGNRSEIGPRARGDTRLRLALACLVAPILAAGCGGGGGEAGERDAEEVRINVATAPTPPIVGPTRIVVELSSPSGPVVDADVRIEARMAGAGDGAALTAEAARSENGHYVVPSLEFDAGGDWVLDVTVELPDGARITRREELRVISGRSGGP